MSFSLAHFNKESIKELIIKNAWHSPSNLDRGLALQVETRRRLKVYRL